ncbi:MAG: TIGR03862 family flavoprotein [Pseudomonadota bacterium]
MTDALVVGAGPAGLMAAQELAQAGISVTVADAKPSPARKFLMAGKSGLNLTLDQPLDPFVATYNCPALAPMVQAFGPKQVAHFAHQLGQPVFTGSSGRVFPKTMKASPLLRAWLARLEDLGVILRRQWRWTGWTDGADHGFETPDGPATLCPTVTVLACGGGSWARLGSDGRWTDWFRNAGLPVVPFAPSNMGVACAWSEPMQRFFGTPLKQIGLTAGSQHVVGECVVSQRGLEGSAIYAVSQALRVGHRLTVDLHPDLTVDQITNRLARPRGKNSLSNHLRKAIKLPDVKRALLREWTGSLPQDPAALAKLIKALPAPPLYPFPLDEAIYTAGGVPFSALTPDLMVKDQPGLFCAGEMLDWDAPTGGYLITACLATGAWAGQAAARYARDIAAL